MALKKIVKEFQDFISRGSVVDLAVGVIVGGAFTTIVNSLVANINNFNVIWLLSRDVYTTSDQLMANANANEVDLLVTWLYRLTQDQSNYKMASVIGILVFVVCAILTLVAFNRMIKGDKEENFQ